MFSERFDLPSALLDYYSRIGAEILNFKRAAVRGQEGHYPTEKASIKVLDDGSIEVSVKDNKIRKKDLDPTEDEQRLIKEQWEIASKRYPRCIEAEKVGAQRQAQDSQAALVARGAKEVTTHTFFNRATGKVTMIHQRFYDDRGVRQFIPHTLWSDGVWRAMEPEGKLPFWKPEKPRKARIMIHEGAKAAEAAERIATDKASPHPWQAFLARYEHWGMIGGALAPSRTNFSELRRETPEEVIYVCDNDWPGKRVLQKVSRLYERSMKGVIFDSRWPTGWDMADPMPTALYHEGRWIGPELEALLKPATYATERVSIPGTTKFASVITDQFAQEWCHSVVPDVYVHREWPNRIYTAQQFNDVVSPFSDVKNMATKLQEEDAVKGVRLTYSPGANPGLHNDDNGDGLLLNTHVPSKVKLVQGDAKPFLDYIDHLVPDKKDRRELLRWVVTLVARPKVKMLYGCLLVSEAQGVGKSTLGEKILAPLMGKHNSSFPSEADIVNPNYNYWCAHKRLAVVHEIYAGHSSKAYDKLKSVVTDRELTVSMKYLAPYVIENWVHVLACSNSMGALRLSQDDRRWFVPKITNDVASLSFWENLNLWLEKKGGLGIIKDWCLKQADEDPTMVVKQGASAPSSETKDEVIQEGYSESMRVVFQALSMIREQVEDGKIEGVQVAFDSELVAISRDLRKNGKSQFVERPLTMRRVAKAAGWVVGKNKITYAEWGVFRAKPLMIGEGASELVLIDRDSS
jgi:hypothetical protein